MKPGIQVQNGRLIIKTVLMEKRRETVLEIHSSSFECPSVRLTEEEVGFLFGALRGVIL